VDTKVSQFLNLLKLLGAMIKGIIRIVISLLYFLKE